MGAEAAPNAEYFERPRKGEPPSQALPLAERARVAQALIGLVIVAALLSLWADVAQLDLISRTADGERITLSEALDSDERVGTTAIIYLVAVIIAAIGFLLWYSRAYRNVIAMGVINPRYGTRWAVAYWFIPIGNLFRPKQVMNDIWRGGDPDLPKPVGAWRNRPVSPLLHWWWAAWLISGFVANFAVRSTFREPFPTPEELKAEATAYVVADVCDVIAGVLAIIVVSKVTARVEERRRRLESGQLSPLPPQEFSAESAHA